MAEETKLPLPAGHPQAGYVEPDLSFRDSVGTLPDEDEKEYKKQVDERQKQVDAVTDHEHKIRTDEIKEAEKAEKAAEKEAAKETVGKK